MLENLYGVVKRGYAAVAGQSGDVTKRPLTQEQANKLWHLERLLREAETQYTRRQRELAMMQDGLRRAKQTTIVIATYTVTVDRAGWPMEPVHYQEWIDLDGKRRSTLPKGASVVNTRLNRTWESDLEKARAWATAAEQPVKDAQAELKRATEELHAAQAAYKEMRP